MSEVSGFQAGKRRLCPDGACIGLIGDDGRCRVCGLGVTANGVTAGPAEAKDGDAFVDALGDGFTAAGDDTADRPDLGTTGARGAFDAVATSDRGAGPHAAPGAGGDGFRPDRRLCDDGSCIGVVGGDGLCAVCGRRAEP